MERIHSLFLLYRFEESILRLWRGPSPRAYSWSGFTLFSFYTASRIHPAPLAQSFSKGLLMERIHSLFLSFRLEDPSCAFGAPLLQGPTHGADSLSFPFIPPQGIILRLWRGPSPRAYSWSGVLSFPFIPLRGVILRLWRAPSSRGYSISKTPFFHLNPSHQSLVTSHQSPVTKKEKSQLPLTLFRDRVSSRKADIGHCFFLPPR